MRLLSRIWPLALIIPGLSLAESDEPAKADPGLNEDTFRGLELRSIGPAFMSGRISDIVLHPKNSSIRYVAVGSGGVWKAVNAGTTWEPVFDSEDSYSIGCITLDPNDPDTVWVGTGENVSGRHVGYGDGIYRSLDGGKSWKRMGLGKSEHIGMIRIDPRDSKIVYAAAQGPLWSPGGDRGLYKSTDDGETWARILGGGIYTGVNEVHLDPRNPDVLYASTWQHLRKVPALMDGGPESGIHKSTDAGATWRELTKGLPEEAMGKIGLAISPQQPDVIYATIELARRTGGFWRSADGGENWEKRNDYLSGGTGPHYYQEIFASPHVFDRVYQMDVQMRVTRDGGKTFAKLESDPKHGDHHAMAFDADDPTYLIVGTDGGIYESLDAGEKWRFVANLPVTQFYKVAVDYDEPFYNVYGGTQDNNTQGGPSRTMNANGVRNSDWSAIRGGDGHQPAADPSNADIVYAEAQQGYLTRYDRRTGESTDIQPQPERGEPAERFNWDAPILISPHDPARLYFASQRLWRSDDRGDSWRSISGDLSRGLDRLRQSLMGRAWSFDAPWDLYAMSNYGSITSLAESPLVAGLLYAGTDDGLIQVSEDGGQNWRRVNKLPGVTDFFFVNDIKADLHDADTVYVVVDHHKDGDLAPYVYKSGDRGRSWQSIRGDLPDRHIVWRLVQDHVKPGLLFAGTEFGVFFTVDGGGKWIKLSGSVPTIAFRDLAIQRRENDLVGATFGRGFYVLDDYTPLRQVSGEMLAKDTMLFPVRLARWYMPRRPLGCATPDCRGSQGDAFFQTPNPPHGAVFTYYLPETIRNKKDQRRELEKPLEKAGKDTPIPGWNTLTEEALEDVPSMLLIVRDASGNVVRNLEGKVEAGFHRVAWELRYPQLEPWVPEPKEPSFDTPAAGVVVEPGRYSVSLARRINGQVEELGQSQSFDVVSIREPTLPGAAQADRVAFSRRTDELDRAVKGSVAAIDELVAAIKAIKTTLSRSTSYTELYREANTIGQRGQRLKDRLVQNEMRDEMGDPGPVPVQARIDAASAGEYTSLHGPTSTHRSSLAIAEADFGEIGPQVKTLLDFEFAALKRKLDEASVPWTPGRGVGHAN